MKKNAYTEMFNVESRHWWYVGLHDLIILLSETLLPQRPLDILDAGCGTGGLLSALKARGHNASGFDYSDDAVAFCHQRGLENVFKANINEWLPAPNSYDLITIMDVLCHKWVLDEVQVLKAMANGLNENGLVMLNYPAIPILGRHHDEVVMIRERYTKKTVERILLDAGLTPVLMSYRLPHAFVVLIFLRLYESFEMNNHNAKSDIADVPAKYVNDLLIRLSKFENKMIARGFPFPFGSSLFVVARKVN